ncbi:MAG: DUF1622 domain-containing protein [Candidatus Nitrosocosmicus sp.]
MIYDIATFTEILEKILRPYIEILTFAIDIAAGIVIAVSAMVALISFLKILTKSRAVQTHEKETIRLRLARGMLLALDFEVGSDILKTILVPGFTELAILAVIVGIRIGLSWSLSKEIDRHHHHSKTKINGDDDLSEEKKNGS